MEVISVRVKPEIAERLKSLSVMLKRSASLVAAEAIEEYLDLHEWQLKAIQKGVEDADQGRLIEFEKFKKEFYGNNPNFLRK